MTLHFLRSLVFVMALAPLAYYVIATYCGWSYFRDSRKSSQPDSEGKPPVSILKPVCGLDREAYENFASFCRLDYPDYEVLFCVISANDPAVPVIQQVQADFPHCRTRLLIGAPPVGASGKVNKLCRLVEEASYDLLVISDSDVRVQPSYLKDVAAPFGDPHVGAVTV